MERLSNVLRAGPDNGLWFFCPGCASPHRIQHGEGAGPRWGWNGCAEKPTFTPSVLVTWRSPEAEGDADELKAQIERKRTDGTPIPYRDRCCHSFVTDGQIQFLSDCTHSLAGQTVPLPAWPSTWD